MKGPGGTDSELTPTKPNPRIIRADKIIPAEIRAVHFNCVTDNDQLPRSQHSNPENHYKSNYSTGCKTL